MAPLWQCVHSEPTVGVVWMSLHVVAQSRGRVDVSARSGFHQRNDARSDEEQWFVPWISSLAESGRDGHAHRGGEGAGGDSPGRGSTGSGRGHGRARRGLGRGRGRGERAHGAVAGRAGVNGVGGDEHNYGYIGKAGGLHVGG